MRRNTRLSARAGFLWAALALLPMVGLDGCRTPSNASEDAAAKPGASYFVRGRVEAVDPKTGSVVLNHEAIAGLMPAMTMTYRLANPTEISELNTGDRITATLLADKGPGGPANLRLTDLDVIAQARPDAAPAVPYHVPAPGDPVPDFAMVNQSGKRIDLGQFRGRVWAMTFVYTRCPLADFCPRMSRNFAEMDQALASDPKLEQRTHLLTVSFDPAYDTPPVLRSYGGAYTGRYSKETFSHWDFAAPSEADVAKMKQWFDVGVTPGPAGSLQHSLATVIVGADGRVLRFYPTNEWTVAQALAVMRQAAAHA